MGWTGGTSIFNAVYKELEELRKRDELHEYNEIAIIKVLIQALWNEDWDTEMDSAYFSSDNNLVMTAIYELDPKFWAMYQPEYEQKDNWYEPKGDIRTEHGFKNWD